MGVSLATKTGNCNREGEDYLTRHKMSTRSVSFMWDVHLSISEFKLSPHPLPASISFTSLRLACLMSRSGTTHHARASFEPLSTLAVVVGVS